MTAEALAIFVFAPIPAEARAITTFVFAPIPAAAGAMATARLVVDRAVYFAPTPVTAGPATASPLSPITVETMVAAAATVQRATLAVSTLGYRVKRLRASALWPHVQQRGIGRGTPTDGISFYHLAE